jgi:hypothetical protein
MLMLVDYSFIFFLLGKRENPGRWGLADDAVSDPIEVPTDLIWLY